MMAGAFSYRYVAALGNTHPEDGRSVDEWAELYRYALGVLALFDTTSIPKSLVVDPVTGRSFLVRALAHPDDRIARAAAHAMQRIIVDHDSLRVRNHIRNHIRNHNRNHNRNHIRNHIRTLRSRRPCIPPASPLHLPCISPASPLHLPRCPSSSRCSTCSAACPRPTWRCEIAV